MDSKCVLSRENRGNFLAVYTAKVRITVQVDGAVIIREAHGTGEGRGTSPGEIHDVALKAAETDATKRALVTFGKPFGLELYRKDRTSPAATATAATSSAAGSGSTVGNDRAAAPSKTSVTAPRMGLHPDDTTPIPRPSTYYGREAYAAMREQAKDNARRPVTATTTTSRADEAASAIEKVTAAGPQATPPTPPLVPSAPDSSPAMPPARIDKSVLTFGEPKRLRNKAHLKFVASQPCLVCGRQPSDPHHLRFAQPRAIGMKVSDEFTVPLCRGHHRQLHQAGNEVAWWEDLDINALEIAKGLWEESHGRQKPMAEHILSQSDIAKV